MAAAWVSKTAAPMVALMGGTMAGWKVSQKDVWWVANWAEKRAAKKEN